MCTAEESWNYGINISFIEKNNFFTFESQINNLCDYIFKTLENAFTIQSNSNNNSMAKNCDDDLRNIMESNKSLRQEIDIKIKELQRQQVRYKTFKHDQKLLSQEIKEKHEAFLMAKKSYKKFLKIYYTIESKIDNKQTSYIQFFTEAKKDSDKYSVRLLKNLESGKYELFYTNPKLKDFKEIQRKLEESNDTPGALCCIREFFLALKSSNKIQIKNK